MATKRSLGILLVALFVSVWLVAQVTRSDSIDSAMPAVLRSLVLDSLRGAGVRGGQLTIAADSVSAVLLRAAQLTVSVAPRDGVLCPGGTASDEVGVPDPVGYRVNVRLTRDPKLAVWVLSVTKSCEFSYRGRQRGYRESGSWEVIKQGGRWILGRSRGGSIT